MVDNNQPCANIWKESVVQCILLQEKKGEYHVYCLKAGTCCLSIWKETRLFLITD